MMRYRLTGCHTGLMCACRAQARDGTDACAKCVWRARWWRRKARRVYLDDP
jgi:hypothetical protein